MSQMSSLSDEQVSKQLAHMCSFIIREAEEKVAVGICVAHVWCRRREGA